MDLPVSVNEVFLGTLASQIGDEWEMLGTYLGLRRDQIERLKQDYSQTDDRIFNMLVAWKQAQRKDTELKAVLLKALRKCGRNDLAQNFHQIQSLSTESLPLPLGLDEVTLRTLSSHLGDEWKKLGKSLGFRQDQIERLTQDYVKTEDRVFNMLVTWMHNLPLDTNLRVSLAEALRRNGRGDIAESVLKIQSPVKEEVSPTNTRVRLAASSNTPTFDVELCQKELITFYEQEMGTVQLLPWGHEVVDMDAIFVNLTLAVDQKLPLGSAGKILETPEELLILKDRNGQRVNRVLVKGFAGSGKSTAMAKLAYDWAKQCHGIISNRSIMSSYDLLFILSLREVDVQKSLIDAIFDQILPKDTAVSRDGLEWYLESHGKNVLVLLDGLDEFAMQRLSKQVVGDTESLLSNRKMRETCVVVTTRPYKVEDLGDHQKHYAHVKLTGFSKDNIEVYIKKFFQDDQLATEGLLKEIQQSTSIGTLAQIPVMLLMLCLLWSDAQQLPDTFTSLYEQAILYLWRRYQNTCDVSRTDQAIKEVLQTLGKVSLHGILSTGKLVFLDSEFPGPILKEACQAGLLTKERLRSRLNINTAVSFLHKSIQEYCAANYWATLAEEGDKMFQSYLQHIDEDSKVFAHEQILSFCCGLSKKAAALILPHVVQILKHRSEDSLRIGGITQSTRKDIWPVFRMLHESQLQYEAMHSWLEPLFQSRVVEIRQNPPASLRYFHYLITNARKSKLQSVLSKVCEVKLFCGSESVGLLVETLDGMTHVESLVLSWETEASTTRLNQSEIVTLSDNISRLSQLKDITILAKYKLDISSMISGLVRGCNCNLRKIELGNVEFDTHAMGYALERQMQLKSLLLTNITLPSQGAAKMLSQTRASLQMIHLVSSRIGDAVQHLRPLMPSLRDLVMRDTGLDEEHICVLADLLPMAGQLKRLDLSWNNVGASMLKLAPKLKHCPCIETLTLVNSNLEQEDTLALTETLKFLPRLENLMFTLGSHHTSSVSNISENNGFVIAEAILRSLPLLPNLTYLHVKLLKIPKTGMPSDMLFTCLAVIKFHWPGIFEQRTSQKAPYFGLLLHPKNLAAVRTAVTQYIQGEIEEVLDLD